MSEIIGCIVATVLLLGVTVALNNNTNTTMQSRCEAQHGEYFNSVDAAHSLCRRPKLY